MFAGRYGRKTVGEIIELNNKETEENNQAQQLKGEEMLASKVTLQKETIEQNDLTSKKKGELRWKKLKELDKEGKLAFIKTRGELAEACGYEKGDPKGASWVFNMLRNSVLEEVAVGYNNGKMEKEYHLTGREPQFHNKPTKKEATKSNTPKTVEKNTVTEQQGSLNVGELAITKDNIAIKCSLPSNEISKIINELLK